MRASPTHPRLYPGTAALFTAALTLSLYVPEHSLQRALQTAALGSMLPALGLTPLVRDFGRRVRCYGSAAYFGALVTLSAFAFDPAVTAPFDIPKSYVVIVASAVLLLGYAMRGALQRGKSLQITWIEVLLAAALLWGLVANPRWLTADDALWFWVSLALVLLTFVTRQLFSGTAPPLSTAGGSRARRTAALDFFTALWINGVALAVLGLRQAFEAGTFQFDTGTSKTPMVGLIGAANGYGAFMAVGIIGALAGIAHARARFTRVLLGGAVLLQLGALLANGSRGALLGLLTAGLLLGGILVVTRRPRLRTAAFTAVGVMLLLTAAVISLYRLNPASGRGRLQAWAISASMVIDHPLRGIGTGRYATVFPVYQAELWRNPDHARWAYQAVRRRQPLSEYIHVLTERGIPGAMLFMLLWGVALASMLRPLLASGRAPPADLGLLALLVAIATHAAVDATLHWVPIAVTLHLALGLVAARVLPRFSSVALQPRAALALLAPVVLYAGVIGVKTAREYGAYVEWRRSAKVGLRRSVHALAAARARLPGEAKLDLQLGTALLDLGQPDSAIVHLERGLARLDELEARLALARAYLEAGRLEPAEQHARLALASFPDRLRPQLVLARVLHAAGRHDQARAALARCIRRDTHFGTPAVDAVAEEAAALWRSYYNDDPPS